MISFFLNTTKKAYQAVRDKIKAEGSSPWVAILGGGIAGGVTAFGILLCYALISPLILYLYLPAKLTAISPPLGALYCGLLLILTPAWLIPVVFPKLLALLHSVTLPIPLLGTAISYLISGLSYVTQGLISLFTWVNPTAYADVSIQSLPIWRLLIAPIITAGTVLFTAITFFPKVASALLDESPEAPAQPQEQQQETQQENSTEGPRVTPATGPSSPRSGTGAPHNYREIAASGDHQSNPSALPPPSPSTTQRSLSSGPSSPPNSGHDHKRTNGNRSH
jgi:hypothetical protein